MTTAAATTLTEDADVHFARANHRWPPRATWITIPPSESPDGNERLERACIHCRIVKITVITPRPSDAWHEWRHPNGIQLPFDHTPPCHPVVSGEVEAN